MIERKPMPAPLYWTLAVSAAGLWALAPIAFALGYGAGVPALRVDQFALLVFAAMAVGPAIFTLLAAYMLRQAIGISAELRHTRALTDRLVTPPPSRRPGPAARSTRSAARSTPPPWPPPAPASGCWPCATP
ncbi:hypothetical protein CSW58_03655, partial [Caulobacter sp. B11]